MSQGLGDVRSKETYNMEERRRGLGERVGGVVVGINLATARAFGPRPYSYKILLIGKQTFHKKNN
jgi:hypothetical protein